MTANNSSQETGSSISPEFNTAQTNAALNTPLPKPQSRLISQVTMALALITGLLGIGPSAADAYYSIVGWPVTPYITHLGPLWYSPWGTIFWLGALALLFLLPLATFLIGLVITFKTRKIKYVVLYAVLFVVEIIWGLTDVVFLLALTD